MTEAFRSVPTLVGMSFRVLVAGPRQFTNYPLLRAALDVLLANRLPDVELLTSGGPGVPILAASYASERGLVVTARVADFVRFPLDAVERRRVPGECPARCPGVN